MAAGYVDRQLFANMVAIAMHCWLCICHHVLIFFLPSGGPKSINAALE